MGTWGTRYKDAWAVNETEKREGMMRSGTVDELKDRSEGHQPREVAAVEE